MRTQGSLDTVPPAARGDHVCWVHDDDLAFDEAVRTFLAGGLARGDRLLCVGERAIDSVLSGAPPLTGVGPLVAAGTLQLMTVAEAYAATGAFAAGQQFDFYDAATRRALDEGYTGLRVVAELSALAADPARRGELVRWEHLADRYIARGPGMTAMCAYSGALSVAALADVTSAHAAAHAPSAVFQFHLFFDGDALALAGSVDLSGADRLAGLLAASPAAPTIVLDISRLQFVDVAGCRAIAGWVADRRARGSTVELRGASRLFRRVWQVLALDHVAPGTFPEEGA